MSRNFWKWTAPILWVTCLGWSYAQDSKVEPTESKPTYTAPREGDYDSQSAPSKRQPLESDSSLFYPDPNDAQSARKAPDSQSELEVRVTSVQQPWVRPRVVHRSVPYTVQVPLTDEEIAQIHDYQNAIAKLRSDESNAEAKTQAQEKLIEILKQMMASDLETRTKEVATLEERVLKLRSQFDNRKAKQDQIIDLRLKTIQNEIDGLGLDQLLHTDGIDVNSQFTPIGGMPGGLGGVGPVNSQPGSEGFGLLGGGMSKGVLPGIAKEPVADDFGGMQSRPLRPMRTMQLYRTVSEATLVHLSPEEIAEREQYGALLKVLRSDEGDDKKLAARNALRQILVQIFKRDLDSREKDLTELEARVKKLRDQLGKRMAAQDQIIELQLTTIQNKIDGLDFNEFSSVISSDSPMEVKNLQMKSDRIPKVPRAKPLEPEPFQ